MRLVGIAPAARTNTAGTPPNLSAASVHLVEVSHCAANVAHSRYCRVAFDRSPTCAEMWEEKVAGKFWWNTCDCGRRYLLQSSICKSQSFLNSVNQVEGVPAWIATIKHSCSLYIVDLELLLHGRGRNQYYRVGLKNSSHWFGE